MIGCGTEVNVLNDVARGWSKLRPVARQRSIDSSWLFQNWPFRFYPGAVRYGKIIFTSKFIGMENPKHGKQQLLRGCFALSLENEWILVCCRADKQKLRMFRITTAAIVPSSPLFSLLNADTFESNFRMTFPGVNPQLRLYVPILYELVGFDRARPSLKQTR